MDGFQSFLQILSELKVPCSMVVDGSFLTEKINPEDIDFAVIVEPKFYDNCSDEQRAFLHWIRDEKEPRDRYLCDCYLAVEFTPGHKEYYDGMLDRAWWVNLYSESVVYKRKRGVAIIRVTEP